MLAELRYMWTLYTLCLEHCVFMWTLVSHMCGVVYRGGSELPCLTYMNVRWYVAVSLGV